MKLRRVKQGTHRATVKVEVPKKSVPVSKNQLVRSYSYFTETAEKLKISTAELSVGIGYGATSHHRWKGLGKIPAVAGLACECLRRRSRLKADAPSVEKALYVLSIPHEHVQTIKAICSAVGISTTKIPEDMS